MGALAPGMEHATIKGIKADFVKGTIAITLETGLDNFDGYDREVLSEWAEASYTVDATFSRSLTPAPLLEVKELQ